MYHNDANKMKSLAPRLHGLHRGKAYMKRGDEGAGYTFFSDVKTHARWHYRHLFVPIGFLLPLWSEVVGPYNPDPIHEGRCFAVPVFRKRVLLMRYPSHLLTYKFELFGYVGKSTVSFGSTSQLQHAKASFFMQAVTPSVLPSLVYRMLSPRKSNSVKGIRCSRYVLDAVPSWEGRVMFDQNSLS